MSTTPRTGRRSAPTVLAAGALAVSLVALGAALDGPAGAVAATLVNIAGPGSSPVIARVDGNGRLATSGTTSTINRSGTLEIAYQNNVLTSPTRATLAITRLMLTNPQQNKNNTTSEVEVFLRKVAVDSSGACTANTLSTLAIYTLEPGDDIIDTMPSPILVTPPAGTDKYCLSLYVIPTNSDGTAVFFQYYSFSAYPAAGTYTGIGLNTAPAVGAKPTDASH